MPRPRLHVTCLIECIEFLHTFVTTYEMGTVQAQDHHPWGPPSTTCTFQSSSPSSFEVSAQISLTQETTVLALFCYLWHIGVVISVTTRFARHQWIYFSNPLASVSPSQRNKSIVKKACCSLPAAAAARSQKRLMRCDGTLRLKEKT